MKQPKAINSQNQLKSNEIRKIFYNTIIPIDTEKMKNYAKRKLKYNSLR
jgi:hypothetical protein